MLGSSHIHRGGPPTSFDASFDKAFQRLDDERGGYNFVSLVKLRQALSHYQHEEFDTELKKLRRAGRYSLSAAEGRHGLSDDERRAGISDGWTLLLYVSRRDS